MRQRRSLFILVMAIFLVFGGLGLFVIADDGIDSVTVTVASGDTLWELCEPYKPERMDLRDFIAKVKYENNLKNSELTPGQQIIIPLQ